MLTILVLFIAIGVIIFAFTLIFFQKKKITDLQDYKISHDNEVDSLKKELEQYKQEIIQVKVENAKLQGELQSLKDNKKQDNWNGKEQNKGKRRIDVKQNDESADKSAGSHHG